MKYFLSLLLSFSLMSCLAQSIKTGENVLYVVDSIPIINDPDASLGTLNNVDIDHLEVVTDSAKIKAAGYPTVNKIIYLTTKEYVKRPEDILKIVTTRAMEKRNGVWYLKDSTTPYNGKFIDYFLNGKIQGEGILKKGVVDGVRIVYYQNGQKNFIRNYKEGVADGYAEQYFQNGNIQQKGTFKNGTDDGLWISYYSTGAVKRQTNFVNQVPDMTADEKKFFNLLSESSELMKAEDFKGAIKKLNTAEKINANYADVYFYRGTSELDNFDFDNAVLDLDKAIALEPLYMEALGNRAFARIRKYQFKDSRKLLSNDEVTVFAAKDKVEFPPEEKTKICGDLNKSVELGDDNKMILDAIKDYCN
jgi:antitoxin component YwqK of YwqJK toxin-antitoxin module